MFLLTSLAHGRIDNFAFATHDEAAAHARLIIVDALNFDRMFGDGNLSDEGVPTLSDADLIGWYNDGVGFDRSIKVTHMVNL